MKNQAFCALFFLSLVLIVGCGTKEAEKSQGTVVTAAVATPEPPAVITAADGSGTVTAEGGWKQASGLHKKAQLQATNSYGDMYLVVFSEKKDRYSGVTLDDYSEVTRGNVLETLTSPSISRPKQITMDGNQAVQYTIRGYTKGSKIAYVHTAVESPLYFHEIIVWTPDARFERNRFALENAISSFKEIQPAAAGTTTAK
jgi:hypothetical protein